MAGSSTQQAMETAISLHRAGRLAEAERLYRQVLLENPRHAEALNMLGGLASQCGKHALAIELMRQSIAIEPDEPRYHNNLGLVLLGLNQLEAAISAFKEAIDQSPTFAEFHNNLGSAYAQKHQYDFAVVAFKKVIELKPGWAQVYHNLGNALGKLGRVEETIEAFKTAVSIDPALYQSCHNLGVALFQVGRLDEASEALEAAIRLRPELAESRVFLGNVRKDQGDVRGAIECYRRAIQLNPDLEVAHSNLLWVLHFSPEHDARAVADEHAAWNRRFALPLMPSGKTHFNDRSPDRRMRIGYVSPDFREHVIGRNILPLLANHDRSHFEIFCYSNVEMEDSETPKFRRHADHWRDISTSSDSDAAAWIENDRIDILVDLALHLERNRMLLFALKPAPVLVSFAGYPGSTGLSTIDFRLSDPYLDPSDMPVSYSTEQVLRLPETFWCYDAQADVPVNELPASSTGFITFGCFNSFCKTNPRTLRLWSGVLAALPESRLKLLSHRGSHRDRAVSDLRIDPRRVEFFDRLPRHDFLKLHHTIDIALDTFPYNGHSTSLDAWWMGVPVVSLCGNTPVSRAGLSQASNLGLVDLVARDDDQFTAIAVALAEDRPRLRELRSTLRSRMMRSPLMDASRFARNIEIAYRQMWRAWAIGGGPMRA